VLWTL